MACRPRACCCMVGTTTQHVGGAQPATARATFMPRGQHDPASSRWPPLRTCNTSPPHPPMPRIVRRLRVWSVKFFLTTTRNCLHLVAAAGGRCTWDPGASIRVEDDDVGGGRRSRAVGQPRCHQLWPIGTSPRGAPYGSAEHTCSAGLCACTAQCRGTGGMPEQILSQIDLEMTPQP